MDYDLYSEVFKALGHPIRLKMVQGLMTGDGCNVNKIVDSLNLPQSTVSQHLKILKNCGIITFRKEGVKTCYKVNNDVVKNIIKVIGE